MLRRKTKIILVIVGRIFAIVIHIPIIVGIILLCCPLLLFNVIKWFELPNPPEPVITYGEFPFELVYEINGETVTVNDVYICEYDGISLTSDLGGKERDWKGYIKGTGEHAVFLTQDEERAIYCFVGDAEFYMNDEKWHTEERPLKPRIYDVGLLGVYIPIYSTEELMERYDIKIISWEFSDPVENTFR